MIPTTLAPFLSVRNGAKAVDFYKSAFGAEELFRLEDPSGGGWPTSKLTPQNRVGEWPIHDIVPIPRVPHSCSLTA
jgi:hypothetical protein